MQTFTVLLFIVIFNSVELKHTRLPECPITDEDVFPEDFLFGAASSAYQIEGAWNAFGKGESIWDRGTHKYPDRVKDGTNGDVAADSFHLYPSDIKALNDTGVGLIYFFELYILDNIDTILNFAPFVLNKSTCVSQSIFKIAELHSRKKNSNSIEDVIAFFQFKAYRFSISWSRIMPTGEPSSLNRAGLDYYHRLIDGLLEAGIKPVATMFHWDLPQPIQDLGGFLNPNIAYYFVDYADVLFREYGDKVKDWITFNEPIVTCDQGYGHGWKPPFIEGPQNGAEYHCAHHLVIANAKAYHLYNEKYRESQGGRVGITISLEFYYPADGRDYYNADRGLQYNYGVFANPIYSSTGGYPQIVVDEVAEKSRLEGRLRSRLPEMDEETKAYVQGTADFLGLNYYTSYLIQEPDTPNSKPGLENDKNLWMFKDDEWETAKSSWLHRVPEGFRDAMNWVAQTYGNPEIWITENGWSDDGQLDDEGRVRYYREHLNEVLKAIKCDGLKVTQYYAWSIIDNFEWMEGYT